MPTFPPWRREEKRNVYLKTCVRAPTGSHELAASSNCGAVHGIVIDSWNAPFENLQVQREGYQEGRYRL